MRMLAQEDAESHFLGSKSLREPHSTLLRSKIGLLGADSER